MVEILIPSEKRYAKLIGKNKLKFMVGKINGCCQQPENLYVADRDDKGKLTAWRCKVCGRNHYRLRAEAGKFGIMDMNEIGGKNG